MGTIDESPGSSEKDSFLYGNKKSTAIQVPSLVSDREYVIPRSRATQAPSVLSADDTSSDITSDVPNGNGPRATQSPPEQRKFAPKEPKPGR